MPYNDLPPYVDPTRKPRPRRNFSVDKVRQEMLDLPRQVGRFAGNIPAGIAHVPFDITAGAMDLANVLGNVAVPGQPFRTDNRGRAIDWAAQRGLTPPEPTGPDAAGYLFGGLVGPSALTGSAMALNRAEPAIAAAARASMPSAMPNPMSHPMLRGVAPMQPPSKLDVMMGKDSPLADLDMLKVAQEAEAKGLPPSKIFDATGWERAKNKAWQFEADTGAVKPKIPLSDLQSPMPLGAAIDSPTLFAGAPHMRDVNLVMEHDWPKNRRGGITPDGTEIHVNAKLPVGEQMKVIEHETSHGVAGAQGLPKGDAYGRIMQESKADIDAADDLLSMYSQEHRNVAGRTGPFKDMPADQRREYLDQINESRLGLIADKTRAYEAGGTPKKAFATYETRAGEAAARNDANRLWMSGDYRRMLPPRATVGLDQRHLSGDPILDDLFGPMAPPGPFVRGTPWEQQTLARHDDIAAGDLLMDEAPRFKRGTRTTVQKPQRKVFPGVYRDPREIIDESAGMVAPPSPNMPLLFNVTRQDLDDMTRTIPQRVQQMEVPVYTGTGRGAKHVQQVMGPANTQRLQDVVSIGAQDPRFAGSYGWYNMEPLEQQMLSMFGPEEGARRLAQLRQLGSGLSPQSAVPAEIKRASLANYAIEQGNPNLFYSKDLLPEGYGHLSHTGSHSQSARRIQDTGQLFPPGYPLKQSPKVRHYDAAKRGQVWNPTADAHFARGLGLPDVRNLMSKRNKDTGLREMVPNAGSLSETEYYPIREWYRDKVARPIDLPGSPAQAIQWNVMGTSTGVDSPLSAPYLELLSDAIAKQAYKRGVSPATMRDRYLAGEDFL